MKKVSIIFLVITIVLIYFIRAGKRTTFNSEGTPDKNLSMSDYFFRGLSSTLCELSPKQTTSLMNISNFCFRTL